MLLVVLVLIGGGVAWWVTAGPGNDDSSALRGLSTEEPPLEPIEGRVDGEREGTRTVVVDRENDLSWTMLIAPEVERSSLTNRDGTQQEGVIWAADLGAKEGEPLEMIGVSEITPLTDDIAEALRGVSSPQVRGSRCEAEPIEIAGMAGLHCSRDLVFDDGTVLGGQYFVVEADGVFVTGVVTLNGQSMAAAEPLFDDLVASIQHG